MSWPHHHDDRMWQSRTPHLIPEKERERMGGRKEGLEEGKEEKERN